MQRGRFDNPSTGPVSRSNPLGDERDSVPAIKSLRGNGRTPAAGRFDSKVTSPEVETLVPIRGTAGKSQASAAARGPSDPYKFWMDYYRTHDETAEQLRETLRILNASGKAQDVYAVLLGYLTYHQKNKETWMYEAAAMAAEMIGKPEDVKKYLGFAADLALKSHNPNALISVADKLYLKGYYERVGPLLDEAAAKVPHRSDPLIMSINLAQQTRDPIRMRHAIRDLLSLGWPGEDDYFRRESRNQADKLAKLLREEGRSGEADDLMASLPDSQARDLFIRLTWTGDANYDLVVDEPLGAKASVAMPRTVFGGAILNDGRLRHAEEVYVCPRGFDGVYQIHVDEAYSDPKNPPTRLTLEVITHEGTPQEHTQTFPLNPAQPGKPIEIKLEGGRRKSVLPFVNPLATFAPLLEAQQKVRAKAARANAPAPIPKVKPEAKSKPARDPIKVEP
jgi:hypothetical protein